MEFSFEEMKINGKYAEVTNPSFTAKEMKDFVGDHWEQVLIDIAGDKEYAIEVAKAAGLTAEDLE